MFNKINFRKELLYLFFTTQFSILLMYLYWGEIDDLLNSFTYNTKYDKLFESFYIDNVVNLISSSEASNIFIFLVLMFIILFIFVVLLVYLRLTIFIFSKLSKSNKKIFYIVLPLSMVITFILNDNNNIPFVFFFFLIFLFSISKILVLFYDFLMNNKKEKKKNIENSDLLIRFRKTITYFKIMNFFILIMIIASTLAGMFIFVYAEDLAKVNTQYNKTLKSVDEITNEYSYVNQELKKLYFFEKIDTENFLNDKIYTSIQRGDLINNEELEKVFKDKNISLRNKKYIKVGEKDFINYQELKKLLVVYNNNMIKFNQSKDNLVNKLKDIEETKKSSLVFVSSIANKIGSILILYFFIQILISIYRYNSKCIHLYESKLITLSCTPDVSNFSNKKLDSFSSFSDIDFEKKDRAPISEMIEVLKNVLTSHKKEEKKEKNE